MIMELKGIDWNLDGYKNKIIFSSHGGQISLTDIKY